MKSPAITTTLEGKNKTLYLQVIHSIVHVLAPLFPHLASSRPTRFLLASIADSLRGRLKTIVKCCCVLAVALYKKESFGGLKTETFETTFQSELFWRAILCQRKLTICTSCGEELWLFMLGLSRTHRKWDFSWEKQQTAGQLLDDSRRLWWSPACVRFW